jgi:hypothetical protein
MNVFIIILIFIGVFISLVGWRRDNKIVLILSLIVTILIVIFHNEAAMLLNKNKILWGLGTFNTVDEISKSTNKSPFIASKWQDSILVHSDPSIRVGMIQDFMTRYKPYQKNKEEILKLLGRPDYSEKLKEWDLVYWLGKEQSLISNNSQWFVVKFDSNNFVTEFDIVTF